MPTHPKRISKLYIESEKEIPATDLDTPLTKRDFLNLLTRAKYFHTTEDFLREVRRSWGLK